MTVAPRLIDIADALEKRGRQEEADYYGEDYPEILSLIYDLPVEKLLYMTVDDISKLQFPPEKPLKYGGWNFWHGAAAFGSNN